MLIFFLILAVDQVLKIYIKTNFTIGESVPFIGNWGYILFVENEGMAFGWQFFGKQGKVLLSLFRIIAATAIGYYLYIQVKKEASSGLILSLTLIFAGAVGNIIDSLFYGMIFTESTVVNKAVFDPGNGYAGFMHGRVVDMFYFPLIEGYYPDWRIVPASLRGDHFIFFRPVFNVADSAITVGVFVLLIFQKRFFHQGLKSKKVDDDAQISEEKPPPDLEKPRRS